MKQEELYKNRSYGGCIKAGYKTMANNYKEIFKGTWLWALVFSIFGGALLTVSMSYSSYIVLNAIATIVFCVATLFWYGKIYSLINGRSLMWNFTRALKSKITIGVLISLIAIALLALYTAIIYWIGPEKEVRKYLAYIYVAAYVLISAIILLIFSLPWNYLALKYQFEPKSKLMKTLFGRLGQAFRYLGLLFTVFIIVEIISFVILLILFSPCDIIIAANSLSNLGVQNGDPSGLPSYFPVLMFIAGMVTMFGMAYVTMWTEFTFYYTYGTIETRENERNKAKSLIYRP